MSNYRMKDVPITERPRERLRKNGREELTDRELIAIILKTGTKDKNVEELALDVLSNFTINSLAEASLEKLSY